MGYWPSYDAISPECRSAYLSWLASGRSDPTADIGYVFLYFYGLERRAIMDLEGATESPEMAGIATELRRLLGIYGSNHSFDTYASTLLDLISSFVPADLSASAPVIDSSKGRNWALDVPLPIRLWLGQCVAAGKGIPADWALAYLRTHQGSGLRTAASRCSNEFDTLFQLRYRKQFGDGIVLKAPKSIVDINYRPASSGFMGQGKTRRFDGVPDVMRASGLINKLQELGSACSDALAAYSRFMGRPGIETSDERGASFPPGRAPTNAWWPPCAIDALRTWATTITRDGTDQTVAVADLVELWKPSRSEKLTRADAVSMATMLGEVRGWHRTAMSALGDVPASLGSSAVVFPLPTGAALAPSPHYAAASVLVYLCAVVASADGSVTDDERQQVAAQLKGTLELDASERRRLEALLSWLVVTKTGLSHVKKRLDVIGHSQRAAIGRLLVDIAAADGVITSEEILTLTKLYRLLELDEAEVYSAIHAIGSDETWVPWPVRMPEKASARWKFPPTEDERPSPVRLDPAKVRARLAETATVTAVLAGIFAEDAEVQFT